MFLFCCILQIKKVLLSLSYQINHLIIRTMKNTSTFKFILGFLILCTSLIITVLYGHFLECQDKQIDLLFLIIGFFAPCLFTSYLLISEKI